MRIVRNLRRFYLSASIACLLAAVLAVFVLGRDGSNAFLSIDPKISDLGALNQGDSAEGAVSIRNVSKVPLIIRRILPDCSCTVPALSKDRLEPAEVAELTFTFHAGAARGRITKLLRVFAAGEDGRMLSPIVIPIVADVNAEYDVVPPLLQLRAAIDETLSIHVDVAARVADRVSFDTIVCSSPALSVISVKRDSTGSSADIELAFDHLRWTNPLSGTASATITMNGAVQRTFVVHIDVSTPIVAKTRTAITVTGG